MNGPVLASLLVSSVWLDRSQYEAAETKSEELKANAHSGLQVEVRYNNKRCPFIYKLK